MWLPSTVGSISILILLFCKSKDIPTNSPALDPISHHYCPSPTSCHLIYKLENNPHMIVKWGTLFPENKFIVLVRFCLFFCLNYLIFGDHVGPRLIRIWGVITVKTPYPSRLIRLFLHPKSTIKHLKFIML